MIITKERDDQNNRREFPKAILEDDNISKNQVVNEKENSLSTKEIVLFLTFCILYIIVIIMQTNVEISNEINNAYLNTMAGKDLDFTDIESEDEFYEWMQGFFGFLFRPEYYDNYEIPTGQKYSVPNLNKLVSTIRITQRRMKLTDITDSYSSAYVSQGWASTGFEYDEDFDASYESTDAFGSYPDCTNKTQGSNCTGIFTYSIEGSFGDLGGYVYTITFENQNFTSVLKNLSFLEDSGFIDSQTRTVVIDYVAYNPYTENFHKYILVATFKANGLLDCSYDLYAVTQKYYSTDPIHIFRCICEVSMTLLIIYYLLTELWEVKGDIQNAKREWIKEFDKNKAKEKRMKEKQKKIEEKRKRDNMENLAKKDKDEEGGDDEEENEDDEEKGSEVWKKTKKDCIQNSLLFTINGLKQHYNEVWNWIDSLILLLAFSSVFYWIQLVQWHIANVASLDPPVVSTEEQNEAFTKITQSLSYYQRLVAVNFVPIFFKLLKYLSYWFVRAKLIFNTLSKAQSDILYFLIMYMVIFFAFVVMCHIYYGSDMDDFSDIFQSLTSLFQMLLGDLEFLDDMIALNEVLSFFFFIAFITSMQFILINMFIAFIANSYTAANTDIQENITIDDELKQTHWTVRLKEFIHKIKTRRLQKAEEKKKELERQAKSASKKTKMMQKGISKKIMKAKKILDNVDKEGGTARDSQKTGSQDNDKDTSSRGRRRQQFQNQRNDEDNVMVQLQQIKLNVNNYESNNSEDNEANRKRRGGLLAQIPQIQQNNQDQEVYDEELTSKKSHFDDQTDRNLSEKIQSEKEEEDQDDTQEIKKDNEEEKAKQKLTSKEWDKDFDKNQVNIDEPLIPSLMSEKQDAQQKKDREIKCGKILWSSIAFSVYVTVYIVLILVQINAEKNYQYISAIKSTIEDTQTDDSNLLTLSDLIEYDEVSTWLQYAVPNFGTQITQEETGYTGYYILDVNYVLDNSMKMCFTLSQVKDPDYNETTGYTAEYWKDFSSSHEYTDTFYGKNSGNKYEYQSDGYQGNGGYCLVLNFTTQTSYNETLSAFINDQIISDKLLTLSLEFITFEASQYTHIYAAVLLQFPQYGIIETTTTVFALDLDPYKYIEDKVRLGFECLYVVLLAYNILIFVQKMINKNRQYKRWKRFEIDSLTELERKQRNQKKPEAIRQCGAVFDLFAIIDIIYFSFAITSMIQWGLYVAEAETADLTLPPNDSKMTFVTTMYNMMLLMQNYTYVAVINTIFLSVKLFDYMNKSKQMKMLSQTLYSSKDDIFYFLLIFIVLMMGFVFFSYVAFGWLQEDYSTIPNAIRSCFSMTIGDFDYGVLYKTNSTMAIIYFYAFNILFVFILTNIFLAIINEAYEKNRIAKKDDDEDINIIQSVFYCFKKKDPKVRNRKNKDQDKNQASNDYLEIFEKLVVNFEEEKKDKKDDIKTWSIICADEIRSELKQRTKLRQLNRDTLFVMLNHQENKDQGGGENKSSNKNLQFGRKMDQVEMLTRRLNYWNYVRCGIQYIAFQNKLLDTVIKQKEEKIESLTQKYLKERQKTQELYKYIAMLEQPVEDKFEQVINYKNLLNMLKQENLLLEEQRKEAEEQKKIYEEMKKKGEEEQKKAAAKKTEGKEDDVDEKETKNDKSAANAVKRSRRGSFHTNYSKSRRYQ